MTDDRLRELARRMLTESFGPITSLAVVDEEGRPAGVIRHGILRAKIV
jgi:hypothetical protein